MAAPSRGRLNTAERTGVSSGPAVQVVGLKEFRKALKPLEGAKGWNRELAAAHKQIARETVGWSQAAAMARGGLLARAAPALSARGTISGARIAVGKAVPSRHGGRFVPNNAFWGMRRTTGWNFSDTPNQPRWVGNTWTVGAAGSGPYAINDAIAANRQRIVNMYGRAVEKIARAAFPD